MLFIIVSAMVFCAIFAVMLLDDWSTQVLLAYKHLNTYNEEAKKKLIELDKKKGVSRYELNPFARFFFKKFGFSKGSSIFNFLVRYPLMAFALYVAWTSGSYYMAYGLLMFYIGVIFGQIMRASATNKFAKEVGINLIKYSKTIKMEEK